MSSRQLVVLSVQVLHLVVVLSSYLFMLSCRSTSEKEREREKARGAALANKVLSVLATSVSKRSV